MATEKYLKSTNYFEPEYLHIGFDIKTRRIVELTWLQLKKKRQSTLERILWNAKKRLNQEERNNEI